MLKKHRFIFIFLLLITNILLPLNVFAYSDYILASGQNIGIELDSNGIIIVGTYQVNNRDPAHAANLKPGDKIVSINGVSVYSINEMIETIDNIGDNLNLEIGFIRGNEKRYTNLELVKDDDDIYKTGLYVKDSVNGVGTLTFIDPNTRLYGALGHEIIEKTTGQKLEIKDGKIYSSAVTSITPSSEGNPGEKNAKYDINNVFGNITKNSTSGIFGNYHSTIPNDRLYKVAMPEEIKLGKASMLTVTSGNAVKEFDINIIKISQNNRDKKNMLFEITDTELLKLSGGIVQGMSGSPIIQGNNIIGAVTHVVVDDCTKGYGIFITDMLKEAEN
ncbi:MAG: SpoIVB peptidase [Bacilli bacterium]|nr:SpoIVB peptidase [Bacilli bacterium]